MAVPSGYSRSTFYGHLDGGEIFNWSLWANEAPSDQAATQAQATAFATEFQNLETTPGTGNTQPTFLLDTGAGYDGVRVYSYNDASGKASFIADAPISRAGRQTAGTNLPNQCALVCSLRTAVAGRSATGRIYLPITKWNVGTGGQLALADVTGIANWVSALITKLNSHIATQHIGVLSQKKGTFQSANAVKVDTKIDIQRRRANRVTPSAYFVSTIT